MIMLKKKDTKDCGKTQKEVGLVESDVALEQFKLVLMTVDISGTCAAGKLNSLETDASFLKSKNH